MAQVLVLDGKQVSKKLKKELKSRVKNIIDKTGQIPVLATILIEGDPSSASYVKNQGIACTKMGMEFRRIDLPSTVTTSEVIELIQDLNSEEKVHGIILQHPVPEQVDERECFETIDPRKDVDGVTCRGFGRMVMGEEAHGASTPKGIMTLLQSYEIELEGRHAVVVGRSAILGKPMSQMLLNKNATVTICHSRTKDLPEHVKDADVVIAAVGKPEFIKGEWIKEGAVVVDAGYHPGGVGDVELSTVIPVCSAYTPVPGGVGPMTIATLLQQTVESAEKWYEKK
jgi:methylenetetrahydrofolate dehydrogenase (NADP+)/methenyltetrahydrofolate cyclohydrolase